MTFMRAVVTFPRGVGAANDGLQRYEALERHTAHRFGTHLACRHMKPEPSDPIPRIAL